MRYALSVLLLPFLLPLALAQEAVPTEITVLVPDQVYEETVLKIDGKLIAGKGGTRKSTLSLTKGKDHNVKIEAVIQPANYYKITRTKNVTIRGGKNCTVDLREKDLKTDRIVVRWVPTPDEIVDEMCKLAKVGRNDTVYDLGCGDGVMLIRSVQQFGAKKAVGIDIDPKILEVARKNVKKAELEDRIELRQGDVLDITSMADANVILLYMGDDLGERLSPMLRKTCKPGTRIVSHRFALGDWQPTRTVLAKGRDSSEYELHLWEVK
jgi:uncharacterized protein (TIGR03000 family)